MESVSYNSVARLLAKALLVKAPLYAVCDHNDRPIGLPAGTPCRHPGESCQRTAQIEREVLVGLTELDREGLLLHDGSGPQGTTRLRLRAELAGANWSSRGWL